MESKSESEEMSHEVKARQDYQKYGISTITTTACTEIRLSNSIKPSLRAWKCTVRLEFLFYLRDYNKNH
jgi:hypothetical protein